MRLEEQTAIVTGAASGFGAGIAHLYAKQGARVVVVDLNGDGAQRVAASIVEEGGEATPVIADVSQSDQVKHMIHAAVERYGHLNVIVNNAGTTHKNQPMLNVDEATFDRVFEVNVKSIYLSAIHGVPVFKAQGGGTFINIASTAGVRPRPGLTWYNASKGAVITMTKSMAVELAPDNIRVVGVSPVAGDTPLLKDFLPEDTPEMRQKFVSTIPLGRMSRPLDVARACLFLASEDAEFITGVCLEVDGGRCI